MSRANAIAVGAVVATIIGTLGAVLPFIGAAVGAGVGGFVAAGRSDEENRRVNAGVAGLVGGVVPAISAFLTLKFVNESASFGSANLTPTWVASNLPGVLPNALAFTVVLGLVGVFATRYAGMNPMTGR